MHRTSIRLRAEPDFHGICDLDKRMEAVRGKPCLIEQRSGALESDVDSRRVGRAGWRRIAQKGGADSRARDRLEKLYGSAGARAAEPVAACGVRRYETDAARRRSKCSNDFVA